MEDTFEKIICKLVYIYMEFANARLDWGSVLGNLESSIDHQFHGRNDSGLEPIGKSRSKLNEAKRPPQTGLEAI